MRTEDALLALSVCLRKTGIHARRQVTAQGSFMGSLSSVFGSGIGGAAVITGLAVWFTPGQVHAEPSAAPLATLEVTIDGAKSSKGTILLALCPPDSGFPDCKRRAVRSASLQVTNGSASIRFSDLPAGNYAVSLFHDANGNSKLDTFLGIPREGFGFSRNPPVRPRAPRFDEAVIQVGAGTSTRIALRHIL